MEQKHKIHPYKFSLWLGIASILMMFAGLTSAVIVKRNQANWISYDIPQFFWWSSLAIIISSITLVLAAKAFTHRQMKQYRNLMAVTCVLGTAFLVLQSLGFYNMWQQGLTISSTSSVAFLYVLAGMHALHALGGLVALIVLYAKSYSRKQKMYSVLPIQLISLYWHFVGILWIYLLVFLIMIR
ncbi:MAG: cytochrome c oxidase subunit 3 [Ferruginibacter sp.]|nr:cytochrome c oxidase subunit 3 [Ferruginibacter sp.]